MSILWIFSLIMFIVCIFALNSDAVQSDSDGGFIVLVICSGIIFGTIVFYPLFHVATSDKDMNVFLNGLIAATLAFISGGLGHIVITEALSRLYAVKRDIAESKHQKKQQLVLAEQQHRQHEVELERAKVIEKTPYEKCVMQLAQLGAGVYFLDDDIKDRISKFILTALKAIEILEAQKKSSMLKKFNEYYITSIIAAIDLCKENGAVDKAALFSSVTLVETMLNGIVTSESVMKQIHTAANLKAIVLDAPTFNHK